MQPNKLFCFFNEECETPRMRRVQSGMDTWGVCNECGRRWDESERLCGMGCENGKRAGVEHGRAVSNFKWGTCV